MAALDLTERLALLARVADTVEEHVTELARLENLEMGKPVPLAEQFIAGGVAGWRQGLERAGTYPFAADVTVPGESGRTVVERRPLGVVGHHPMELHDHLDPREPAPSSGGR
ncbi:aldehyde dehydrogenase family protein [Streptomyces antimycoticus]|uniref:aldehyde dehydrogenase family protein n=1 Tax=Streptomyces antimycoticus TaxID=68175 RepID=UPI001B32594F|nr:aldehyde dehydrogenase family protein [Streptomyces sp. AgN23]